MHRGGNASDSLEGYHTVRRPREMDPTNFSVETVRGPMAIGQTT